MAEEGFLRTPVEITCLSDRLAGWKRTSEGYLMIPKPGAHFDRLLLRYQWIRLSFDKLSEFVGIKQIVSREEMDEEFINLFRRMKGFECQLSWSGLIRKRPSFVPHSSLENLRRILPEIRLDNRLAEELSSSKKTMQLLRKVQPEELHVVLHSVPEPLGGLGRISLESVADYFRNPREVTWVVVATKMLQRLMGYRRNVSSMFDLVDSICEATSRVTAETRR